MPVRNNFGPSKNTVEKETPKENAKKLSQLRVFGIADREHLDSLAWFLDTPDINCMGVLPPRSSVQSVEDTVDKVAAMPIDVLVILASVFDGDFQAFMQEYGKNRSGVASVLVTDSTIDVDLLQAAMASGINNVVYATDLDKNKVCDVIWKEASKNLSRNESAEVLSYSSRVVLTYSSKGGVGKTTVAVNLASALTQRGKKVVVVDLDLASGTFIPSWESIMRSLLRSSRRNLSRSRRQPSKRMFIRPPVRSGLSALHPRLSTRAL